MKYEYNCFYNSPNNSNSFLKLSVTVFTLTFLQKKKKND